jgi:hypothetical protein
MKFATQIAAALVIVVTIGFTGCKSSHEEGVKSDFRSQWTMVKSGTVATTDAAKAVFENEGFKDVTATSTAVDGKATGKLADGTKVTATIAKKDSGSEVTVVVGTMGDPKLGANLAEKIRVKADGPNATTMKM